MPDYEDWLREALGCLGGEAYRLQVCRTVWELHKKDLPVGTDGFYEWQYRINLAAEARRRTGELNFVNGRKDRPWTFVQRSEKHAPRPVPQPEPELDYENEG